MFTPVALHLADRAIDLGDDLGQHVEDEDPLRRLLATERAKVVYIVGDVLDLARIELEAESRSAGASTEASLRRSQVKTACESPKPVRPRSMARIGVRTAPASSAVSSSPGLPNAARKKVTLRTLKRPIRT